MTITGTRCTASYQNAVYFRPQCNGVSVVEDPDGLVIFNGETNKGQWVKVVDAFCRDMFDDGEIGKYQESYEGGRSFDITVVCNGNDLSIRGPLRKNLVQKSSYSGTVTHHAKDNRFVLPICIPRWKSVV